MQWNQETDFLVVGSGNGAMAGAICAHDMGAGEVLVIEKGSQFGGTSALSGGGVWVPCNRYAKEAGAIDSFEEALTYLKAAIPAGLVAESQLRAYLANAPKMIDFLHQRTRVRYQSLEKYPDYYSDKPGSKTGHRSIEPVPINMSALGEEENNILDHGAMYILYKYALTQVEAQVIIGKLQGWRSKMAWILLQYYLDIPWLLKGKGYSRRTTGGGAGIIRLRLSMKDRNIPLWLNTALEELITEEGRVIGARVRQNGKELLIRARKGVLLATGGFEYNQAMREQYLPKPTNVTWSAGCHTNTGDGIRMAEALGAETRLMENAWWCTTKVIPGVPYPFLSIITKSMPGSICVNRHGKRFSNESQNYMQFLKETFQLYSQGNPCIPCYMVFDSHFRKTRNAWPALLPDFMLKKEYFDSGLMARGNTIRELATNMGVDADGLDKTVQQFNEDARSGKDREFQRGDAAYDRYYGDPLVTPNPCLAPIVEPPFFAITLQAGDFGTQGGMVINENAQVMNKEGTPIAGLYACGNCTAATLPTYPGPGSTLGPAMTFAYQAAKHVTEWKD
jgi:3-oxosteroid 1-dehydrogenase